MDGAFKTLGAAGGILVAAGLVVMLMAWDGMDRLMPTQVPPRRFARYLLAAGAVLVVVSAIALAVPGG